MSCQLVQQIDDVGGDGFQAKTRHIVRGIAGAMTEQIEGDTEEVRRELLNDRAPG